MSLSPEKESIIKRFHELYYYSNVHVYHTYWLGVRVQKQPMDLWIYQEIIHETKPDVIIETGTAEGGSALFFASICDLIGHGRVITVDIGKTFPLPPHPRITKVTGNSVSREVVEKVRGLVGDERAMVSLDSDHRKGHVLREMELYGDLVAEGCYMVVEDTNINGHPVLPQYGEGPMEAVEEFLSKRNDFIVDKQREKFFLTFHHKGFLKRVKRG